MSKVLSIVAKNFKNYFRFRSNLLLFVLYPVLVILLFFMISTNLVNSPIGVYDGQIDYPAQLAYSDFASCENALKLSKVVACVGNGQIVYDNTDMQVYYKLNELYGSTFEFEALYKLNNSYLLTSHSFIAIIIMFLSIFFASSLLVAEKNSNTILRNKITGTSNFVFLMARLISTSLLILLQLIIVLILFSVFVRASILYQPFFYLVVLVGILFFNLVGLLIGYISKNYQNVAILSLIVSLAFYVLDKNVYFLKAFNPYSILSQLVKGLNLFNYFNINSFNILLVELVILFILVFFVMSLQAKKFLKFKRRDLSE